MLRAGVSSLWQRVIHAPPPLFLGRRGVITAIGGRNDFRSLRGRLAAYEPLQYAPNMYASLPACSELLAGLLEQRRWISVHAKPTSLDGVERNRS